jgi:hypothetical protein
MQALVLEEESMSQREKAYRIQSIGLDSPDAGELWHKDLGSTPVSLFEASALLYSHFRRSPNFPCCMINLRVTENDGTGEQQLITISITDGELYISVPDTQPEKKLILRVV